jgi:hypothetical protein
MFFKEKLWVWDPVLVLTITSPYVGFKFDSYTFTMGQPYASADLNHMPVSTLSSSQGLRGTGRYTGVDYGIELS